MMGRKPGGVRDARDEGGRGPVAKAAADQKFADESEAGELQTGNPRFRRRHVARPSSLAVTQSIPPLPKNARVRNVPRQSLAALGMNVALLAGVV